MAAELHDEWRASSSGAQRQRAAQSLVIAQVSLVAVLLLAAAGLTLKEFLAFAAGCRSGSIRVEF